MAVAVQEDCLPECLVATEEVAVAQAHQAHLQMEILALQIQAAAAVALLTLTLMVRKQEVQAVVVSLLLLTKQTEATAFQRPPRVVPSLHQVRTLSTLLQQTGRLLPF